VAKKAASALALRSPRSSEKPTGSIHDGVLSSGPQLAAFGPLFGSGQPFFFRSAVTPAPCAKADTALSVVVGRLVREDPGRGCCSPLPVVVGGCTSGSASSPSKPLLLSALGPVPALPGGLPLELFPSEPSPSPSPGLVGTSAQKSSRDRPRLMR